MDLFKQLFFVLAPLVAQGIVQVQGAMGVNHPTIAGSIAGWILAATLSARAVVSQQSKNVAAGSDVAGGGA